MPCAGPRVGSRYANNALITASCVSSTTGRLPRNRSCCINTTAARCRTRSTGSTPGARRYSPRRTISSVVWPPTARSPGGSDRINTHPHTGPAGDRLRCLQRTPQRAGHHPDGFPPPQYRGQGTGLSAANLIQFRIQTSPQPVCGVQRCPAMPDQQQTGITRLVPAPPPVRGRDRWRSSRMTASPSAAQHDHGSAHLQLPRNAYRSVVRHDGPLRLGTADISCGAGSELYRTAVTSSRVSIPCSINPSSSGRNAVIFSGTSTITMTIGAKSHGHQPGGVHDRRGTESLEAVEHAGTGQPETVRAVHDLGRQRPVPPTLRTVQVDRHPQRRERAVHPIPPLIGTGGPASAAAASRSRCSLGLQWCVTSTMTRDVRRCHRGHRAEYWRSHRPAITEGGTQLPTAAQDPTPTVQRDGRPGPAPVGQAGGRRDLRRRGAGHPAPRRAVRGVPALGDELAVADVHRSTSSRRSCSGISSPACRNDSRCPATGGRCWAPGCAGDCRRSPPCRWSSSR